ncbi:hypothetical protein B0T19DRAFT_158831 [Cercophora scortea]|uniref:Uncharacterized protein n=1 Tax=Cercophora scortea TaxID=314031 RepID=A0AAE0ILE5_9PEZI|nr:hypothetical protein B0T19DRAFT_158831 [Cercophora scortea]
MSGYGSFVISDHAPSSDNDDVDSLPSISSGVLSSEGDSTSNAQEEWEASLEQLQLLLTMVLVPFAGKFLGRKFAYWSRLPRAAMCTCHLANTRPSRLGTIYGMDAQRRDYMDEQKEVQRSRCGRGRLVAII